MQKEKNKTYVMLNDLFTVNLFYIHILKCEIYNIFMGEGGLSLLISFDLDFYFLSSNYLQMRGSYRWRDLRNDLITK